MASRAWPSSSPSRPADTPPASTRAWSAAWSTACPRPARTAATALWTALTRHGLRLIAGVPHRPELTWPRVGDLVRELNPEILHEGDLSRRIKDVAVFAQGIPGGIRVLDDGRLIVVPGDRHEVIMAACLAAMNGTGLAALLLSAGIRPDPQVWELTRAPPPPACRSCSSSPTATRPPPGYETWTRGCPPTTRTGSRA